MTIVNEQPSVGDKVQVSKAPMRENRLRHYTVTAVDDEGVTVTATYAGEATDNYTTVAWDRARALGMKVVKSWEDEAMRWRPRR